MQLEPCDGSGVRYPGLYLISDEKKKRNVSYAGHDLTFKKGTHRLDCVMSLPF